MARRRRDLVGSVAAVTGGARGIGLATAGALARAGLRVAIGDLDGAEARRAAERVGGGAAGFELDVTDRASFSGFLGDVERALGPLDVLVNNAGIMQVGLLDAEADLTTRRMVDINVHGVVLGMKLALPGMRARRRGHLVNVASFGGRVGFAGGATYCGTKFFVIGASEAVRAELRGSGVEVSCVMPAHVATELTSGLRQSRLAPPVAPDDVARAIVEVLQRPRFDVYVPRQMGAVVKLNAMMPRVAREALGRLAKADRYLLDLDEVARRDYERRAAASEPALVEAGAVEERH
jgi:NADP-dependent 3-hydroxy acid dehydrogenase YdfG